MHLEAPRTDWGSRFVLEREVAAQDSIRAATPSKSTDTHTGPVNRGTALQPPVMPSATQRIVAWNQVVSVPPAG